MNKNKNKTTKKFFLYLFLLFNSPSDLLLSLRILIMGLSSGLMLLLLRILISLFWKIPAWMVLSCEIKRISSK